ncbi:vacuolar transporter chaperone 3 [Blumeria hordei DH14]|uniref:Vacuolar transporter chaperone 3 n=1 Tax=Blumeria graminis f. sp. hordei (strain DH14) TaxID=546991 RepID=N1JHS1_BLUG1|nr:vacuolar transporter chaperone 3 [Blumeria hordei DH14]
MKFGRTLRKLVNASWKDQYVDYAKLKSLLKEDVEEHTKWTEDDENKFCDEIFNVQLEKVASFQERTFRELESRTNKAATELQELAPEDDLAKKQECKARFREIETELDDIITETKELKRYSELNYTAFLKIVKKHDRKRGNNYKIRPMLLMSLSKRPFNNELEYSPLLTKLSIIYYALRQHLDEDVGDVDGTKIEDQSQLLNGERYTAYKFWIHPENLLEVKTYILRRLPVLVYSQIASNNPEAVQSDPTICSLYFDSPNFLLYDKKTNRKETSSSLRIRWFGQLSPKSELFLELKTIHENGQSEEKRFAIKEKYIQPFINGEYKMEKSIAKMRNLEQPETKIEHFKQTFSDIQKFILENDLQPVLRAQYMRTAFQKPLDDRVRISIDTNLAFIREDCIDLGRPCRNPENWHRLDVDNMHMTYPFSNLNQGEINRFPYAVLEIKVKDENGKKFPQWVEDLMASHLLYKTLRFSKFVHGVAVLFEDNVNNLPFWLPNIEVDIRKDPHDAFEEEVQRKTKEAENEQVVGSLLCTSKKALRFKASAGSQSKSYLQDRLIAEEQSAPQNSGSSNSNSSKKDLDKTQSGYGTMASLFPVLSTSRYAQGRRNVILPPGVTKPEALIKDSGPVQVEPKVWLANERTFVKWMQITIQLAVLGIGLNAAGSGVRSEDKKLITWFSAFYLAIAGFTGWWGLYIQKVRREMIIAKSGRDFDNWIGPVIVGCAFLLALILNFWFKFRAVKDRYKINSVDMPSTELV